jgi:hypothetical protein
MIDSFSPFEIPIANCYGGKFSRLITCVGSCEDPSRIAPIQNPLVLEIRRQLFEVLLRADFK